MGRVVDIGLVIVAIVFLAPVVLKAFSKYCKAVEKL